MRVGLIIGFILLLCLKSLWAEMILPEVRVFGRESESRTQDSTILEGGELVKTGAGSLVEALAQGIPGLIVEKRGGRETRGELSLRGLGGERILIVIDGIPREPEALDAIPLDEVARVEVVRGAGSARFGERALGGAILVSLKSGRDLRPGLTLGYGSHQTSQLTARLPLSWETGGLSLAVNREASAGGWHYPGQVVEAPDGSTSLGGKKVESLNTGFLTWGLRLSGEYAPDLTKTASAKINFLSREAGVPGTIDYPTARAALKEHQVSLNLETAWLGVFARSDETRLRFLAGYRDRRYQDFDLYDREERYQLGEFSLTGTWAERLGESFDLKTGFKLQALILESEVAGGTETTGRQTRLSGEWVGDLGYQAGRLGLNGSLTLGLNQGFAPRLCPSLGASLVILPELILLANLGTAWRSPSLSDLFWPTTAFAVGNPELKPESSRSLDLGLKFFLLKGLELGVTGFLQDSRELINWQASAGGVWRPHNLARVISSGIEVVADWRLPLGKAWELKSSAEYSLQANRVRARASGDETQLPRVPREKAALALSLSQAELGELRLALAQTGFRYLNLANTKYLKAHLLVDLGLTIKLGKGFTLRGSLNNLFDQSVVHLREYPLPGREGHCLLEVKF